MTQEAAPQIDGCEACFVAQHNPQTGMYRFGCPECSARVLANSAPFWRSQARGTFDPSYLAALKRHFGDASAQWEAGHKRVREWARRIDATSTHSRT